MQLNLQGVTAVIWQILTLYKDTYVMTVVFEKFEITNQKKEDL